MVDKIDKLKELLSDFSPRNENTVEPASTYIINYGENTLNPDLMSYCFDTILGFKVYYRISEKVNYEIHFDYKGTHGYVVHRKLSYEFSIDETYKEEIIILFSEVRGILEEYFLECSEISLNKNEFTMENEYIEYYEKFTFYEERIEELNEKSISIKEEKNQKLKDIDLGKGNAVEWSKIYNGYNKKHRKIILEMKYAIESYIDVFYSFLEHVLTLLYPFSDQFDLSVSYYKNYIHNRGWTWNRKIIDTFSPLDMTETIKKLREIKEIHRNRNAHGSFSKELKVYASIKGLGRYPLYVGKEYLQGFTEDFDIQLNYDRYIEYKKVFHDFFDIADKEYPIPMVYIKTGLPISVDVDYLIEDVKNEDDAEKIADMLLFELDNQLNMDW